MNSTSLTPVFYNGLQKGFLMPSTFVATAIGSFALYKYAKRHLSNSETFGERMHYLYSAIAGALIGQFFSHSLPNSGVHPFQGSYNGYGFVSAFFLIGIYAMYLIQKCARITNENPDYTAPDIGMTETRSTVNSQTMQEETYYSPRDTEGEQFSTDMWILTDEAKLKKRRRFIGGFLFVIMLFISVFEGLFLVYRMDDPGLLIAMFVLDKLLETVVVAGALIHGWYHMLDGGCCRRNTFAILTIIWTIWCSLTTLFVVVDLPFDLATLALQHPATGIVYALCGGILLWGGMYFMWMDERYVRPCAMVGRLIIFAIFMAGAWLTGFFV